MNDSLEWGKRRLNPAGREAVCHFCQIFDTVLVEASSIASSISISFANGKVRGRDAVSE